MLVIPYMELYGISRMDALPSSGSGPGLIDDREIVPLLESNESAAAVSAVRVHQPGS